MELSKKIKTRLAELPREPGVYFYKDAKNKIIYIGKAANLRNRVRQYFQSSRNLDFKTKLLVEEIATIDWITVASEVEALFLESEMIKRYKPKYNIELKDNKNWLYVRVPMKEEFPRISFVRRPLDDGAEYFGPYTSGGALRKAMRFLRKTFPYVTHQTMPKRACLHYHLGLCPGPEVAGVISEEYKKQLRRLMSYLRGNAKKVQNQLEKEMKQAAKNKDYEKAAELRDKIQNLRSLSRQHLFGDREMFDLTRDQALVGLKDKLELNTVPRRIEAYDISHIQGTNNTASMVVFTDGVPNRGEYRKFKMRTPGNDDFAHMREVMTRRFSKRNLTSWPKPDLIVIDGGKGQLSSALQILGEKEINIPAIGLAKREETIIRVKSEKLKVESKSNPSASSHSSLSKEAQSSESKTGSSLRYEEIKLPRDTHALKLLQHLRDEAHRFAVTYHSLLRTKKQTASFLEEVPGVGPATRKKLIKHFGSLRGVQAASQKELAEVVGENKAKTLYSLLSPKKI